MFFVFFFALLFDSFLCVINLRLYNDQRECLSLGLCLLLRYQLAKRRLEASLDLSPSPTSYFSRNWTNGMPSLSISFLIYGEDNAYVVLGSIFKESGNTGIGYMRIASIESHCHPTRGPQGGAMGRGTQQKLQVIQAPTPQYR